MSFELAVCAEMVYLELPLVERIYRIHEAGFAAEIWDWTAKDAAELRATGATFTSMTGYVTGDLITADGADDLLRTAERSIPFAQAIRCPSLNLHGTGLGPGGLPVRPVEMVTGEMWLAAERTLSRIAELGERHGVTFVLENLNTEVDHPGTPFARAADTLALVAAVDSPHLKLNLDLYHAQIGEGNLVELIHRAAPHLGEVQVADVPGRCEPGTGEINWPFIARALADAGYDGVVAMEAFASGDPDVALRRFREAFTI
ncbi:MAG: hydroxypyruvate isomerase [Nocardioidaceae bacterium]|nr:hydroxypyruvate isomerase [Nocardioidaceae bacterium]